MPGVHKVAMASMSLEKRLTNLRMKGARGCGRVPRVYGKVRIGSRARSRPWARKRGPKAAYAWIGHAGP